MSTTPAAPGCRMPAEWERHEATWIAWPHQRDDWPGKFEPIPWVYAEIVRQLHPCEIVRILVNDARAEERARQFLGKVAVDMTRTQFFHARTDRVWTRDYGPLFVTDEAGAVAVTDWQFNGWAKYDNWRRDNAVTPRICKQLGFPSRQPIHAGNRVVLEGGSIDVDGRGLLLTTEECLLSPIQQRNPGLERGELERLFAEYLGIRKVLWLGRGIAGDDTHGHVDDLARFVAPGRVVAVVEDDPRDVNFVPLQENLARLKTMTDLEGRPLEVATLPMPAPLLFEGQRLPASYANFYIANDRVLVPTFNDPRDRQALTTLAELFPRRTIIGIHAVDLVWGLGTLHCLTQQQPEARTTRPPRRRQFMATLDKKRLKALESRLGAKLPSAFTAILRKREPIREGDVALTTPKRVWEVRSTFGLDDGEPDDQLDRVYERVGEVLPPGAVPIAADWGGNFYCLMLSGPRVGQVVYWDHERAEGDVKVERVAETVESFYARLVPVPSE